VVPFEEVHRRRRQRFEVALLYVGLRKGLIPNTSSASVDLVKMGNMRIGSQMDLFFKVYSFPFDAGLVQRNFALLPQSDNRGWKIRCLDGVEARSTKSPPPGHQPDGEVAHYYVPLVLRCASCGNSNSLSANTRCARCKIVHYCSKECQVRDWKLRHRKVCKSLGTLCEK
jgi:hypothetical protein